MIRKLIIFTCCLIGLMSCNQANTQIHVHYKQQVNGYDVTCFLDRGSYCEKTKAVSGRGFLHFKNEEREFVVENPLFADCNLVDNERSLKNGMTIEVDYTPFATADTHQPFIRNKSPFFFYDIDFDGTEELIVCLWEGMDYKGHHAYRAYKMNVSTYQFSPMQEAPFNELNDYTEFDTINKTISIPQGVGVKMGGKKVYGLVDGSFALIERVEYDWEHTKGVKYEPCSPTIYHYKIVDGTEILDRTERCPNDK